MLLKEVIGQQAIKERFIKNIQSGRISHAQLLAGPQGSGKLQLAIAIAQYVNCKQRTESDSCGVCSSCRKYQKLIHPDLHFVFPVVRTTKFKQPVSDNYLDKWRDFVLNKPAHELNNWLSAMGAENQQAGIFTHESAEILRKLNMKTYEAEYKIMVIWLPEKMNESAANKLLKILEEPPAKTLFLLVSDDTGSIIRTILSRTQLTKIPQIDSESLSKALQEKYDLEQRKAQNISRVANGNFSRAVDMIETSEESEENFENFIQLMRLAYSRKVLEIMKWSETVAKKGREKQKNFLEYVLRLIRENFIMNIGNSNQELLYLTDKEEEFSSKFSNFIKMENAFEISEEVQKAYYHIERNGSAKIIFLDLSLNIIKLLRK